MQYLNLKKILFLLVVLVILVLAGVLSKPFWDTLDPSTQEYCKFFVAAVAFLVVLLGLLFRNKITAAVHPNEPPPFPYKHCTFQELVKSRSQETLEKYVEREDLKCQLGPNILPDKTVLLIHGLSGVGKTREAFEFIRRLNSFGRCDNVYLANRSVEVPIDIPFSINELRNIVLFIDDFTHPLRWEVTGKKEKEAIEKDYSVLLDQLIGTIEFFKNRGVRPQVILTCDTHGYNRLVEESQESPRLCNYIRDNFKVLELQRLTRKEKQAYLNNLAESFNFKIENEVKEQIVGTMGESLMDLYNAFKALYQSKIEVITAQEVTKRMQNIGPYLYKDLNPDEKIVFDVLSILYQVSVDFKVYLVTELCTRRIQGSGWFWNRWILAPRIEKAINGLNGNWIEVRGDEIYCHGSRLYTKDVTGPLRKEDLLEVKDAVYRLTKKGKYAGDLYPSLRSLSKRFYEYKEYSESMELLERMLAINNKDDVALFNKGICCYKLGEKFWEDAKKYYEGAIEINSLNLFARNALSILYLKQGDASKAIEATDEIIRLNTKDLLAYITKLNILRDTGINDTEAKKTYKTILKLLKSEEFPSRLAISSELACISYSGKFGVGLKERGKEVEAKRRLEKTKTKYENLIERIPLEEKELTAIILNSYGCFLCDILENVDGAILQLERAHDIWPHHTYSLHKLATIYYEWFEDIGSEIGKFRLEKAINYLTESLKIDPSNYAALQMKARLEGELMDWININESKYWNKVNYVYQLYQKALKPETSYPSMHNAKTHHVIGSFLWHVEAAANSRHLLENRPQTIPAADIEFKKCIEEGERFNEPRSEDIQDHIILGYFTLGSYYKTLGLHPEGDPLIYKAHKLSLQWRRDFKWDSQNSYVLSTIGKIYKQNREWEKAKEYFTKAVDVSKKNWRAWWWLGRIYEYEDFNQALPCFERCAEGQKSPKLFGEIRGIVLKRVKNGKMVEDIDLLLKYSEKAYNLDPDGDYDPKNISDYGYDLYIKGGKVTYSEELLKTAETLLMKSYTKYIKQDKRREASMPLWFATECTLALNGYKITENHLRLFLEASRLQDTVEGYSKLLEKINLYADNLRSKGSSFSSDIINELVSVASSVANTKLEKLPDGTQFPDSLKDKVGYDDANHLLSFKGVMREGDRNTLLGLSGDSLYMDAVEKLFQKTPRIKRDVGIIIQRNRRLTRNSTEHSLYLEEQKKAKGLLEEVKEHPEASKNSYFLRALFECYRALGETPQAKSVYLELIDLLPTAEKEKLIAKYSKKFG